MKPMKPMKPMEPMEPMKSMQTPASDWWPADLDHPGSSGAQDGLRYAFFPQQRRLVIERDGQVEQYETGDHQISGVSQASGSNGPTFTSQNGDVDLSKLNKLG